MLCQGEARHAFVLNLTASDFIEGNHTCPECKAQAKRAPMSIPFDPKTLEAISKNRGRGVPKCMTLPKNFPGADSYTPQGHPQFNTLRGLEEAGKRYGLRMD